MTMANFHSSPYWSGEGKVRLVEMQSYSWLPRTVWTELLCGAQKKSTKFKKYSKLLLFILNHWGTKAFKVP